MDTLETACTEASDFFEALKTDDGQLITEMRLVDGYINATKMCQSAGKLFGDYARNTGTKNYLDALQNSMGCPVADLVESTATGPYTKRGSWVHPDVATHLAQWCSPIFAVKVSQLVRCYATGKITTEDSRAAARVVNHSLGQSKGIERLGKKRTFEEQFLIKRYANQPTVYIASAGAANLYKFGSTGNISARVSQHKGTFSGFELINVWQSDNHLEVERRFKNDPWLASRTRKCGSQTEIFEANDYELQEACDLMWRIVREVPHVSVTQAVQQMRESILADAIDVEREKTLQENEKTLQEIEHTKRKLSEEETKRITEIETTKRSEEETKRITETETTRRKEMELEALRLQIRLAKLQRRKMKKERKEGEGSGSAKPERKEEEKGGEEGETSGGGLRSLVKDFIRDSCESGVAVAVDEMRSAFCKVSKIKAGLKEFEVAMEQNGYKKRQFYVKSEENAKKKSWAWEGIKLRPGVYGGPTQEMTKRVTPEDRVQQKERQKQQELPPGYLEDLLQSPSRSKLTVRVYAAHIKAIYCNLVGGREVLALDWLLEHDKVLEHLKKTNVSQAALRAKLIAILEAMKAAGMKDKASYGFYDCECRSITKTVVL